jgi:hypothetical protein
MVVGWCLGRADWPAMLVASSRGVRSNGWLLTTGCLRLGPNCLQRPPSKARFKRCSLSASQSRPVKAAFWSEVGRSVLGSWRCREGWLVCFAMSRFRRAVVLKRAGAARCLQLEGRQRKIRSDARRCLLVLLASVTPFSTLACGGWRLIGGQVAVRLRRFVSLPDRRAVLARGVYACVPIRI